MDIDLAWATPIDTSAIACPEERQHEVSRLWQRAKATQQFLKGEISSVDFLDFLEGEQGIDSTEFLDTVEANFNHVVSVNSSYLARL